MDNVRPVVAFNSVEEFWGCVPLVRLAPTSLDLAFGGGVARGFLPPS